MLVSIFGLFFINSIAFAGPKTLFCTDKCGVEEAANFLKNYNAARSNITQYVLKRSGFDLYDFMQPYIKCDGYLGRYPGQNVDGGKYVCDSSFKNKKECIIYSLGSNNEYSFENEMYKKFGCEIHTFDCTAKPNWNPPKHVKLHPWCSDSVNHGNYYNLTTIMRLLNHSSIDLLKVDIEEGEFETFKDLVNIPKENLPKQIAVEIHHFIYSQKDFNFALKRMEKVFALYDIVLKLGYSLLTREDNPGSGGTCTEIVLIKE